MRTIWRWRYLGACGSEHSAVCSSASRVVWVQIAHEFEGNTDSGLRSKLMELELALQACALGPPSSLIAAPVHCNHTE